MEPPSKQLANGCSLQLVQGDITDQTTEAIVNAANARLAGGGGVDGAIHRRGGPQIMAETDERHPDGCPTGSAVLTGAGDLPCKYVLHAVGPVWSGGNAGEREQLASAYRTCLELACDNGCESVAFPALSAGAYRYPLDQAAQVALQTCADFLASRGAPRQVRFVLFDAKAMQAFERALGQLPDA